MKKVILLIIIICLFGLNNIHVANAQNIKQKVTNIFKQDGITSAIKSCKKISVKDIEETLGMKNPSDMLYIQYSIVENKVGPALKTIMQDYNNFSKKNSNKMETKKFPILDVEDNIKKILIEFLSNHQGALLETNKEKIDSVYIAKVSHEILKQYYVKE